MAWHGGERVSLRSFCKECVATNKNAYERRMVQNFFLFHEESI